MLYWGEQQPSYRLAACLLLVCVAVLVLSSLLCISEHCRRSRSEATKHIPASFAATSVVPEPANGSTNRPPGRPLMLTARRGMVTGNSFATRFLCFLCRTGLRSSQTSLRLIPFGVKRS